MEHRSKLIIALLLAMVGLTGVLTYQAQDAARSHRVTAERALHSYATIAAWNLWKTSGTFMFDHLRYAVDSVRISMPPPERLAALARSPEANHCSCLQSRQGRINFVLVGPAHVVVSDEPLPAPLRSWLSDSLPGRAAAPAGRTGSVGLAFPSAGPEAVAFAQRRSEAAPTMVFGYVTSPASFAHIFSEVLRIFPVLPREQTGGRPNETLLSAEVTTPSGALIYHSPHVYPHTFSASEVLPPLFGSIDARVSLRPEAADLLVIGGLPRSRLPLLLGLLALTVALVAVAVLQLRREAELARMREDFISSVSHELRTPLAQIRMFAETLLLGRTRSEAERRRSLEIIDQEARRLTHLVENILRMSRSARGVSEVVPESVELTTEMASIIESFRMLAAPRRVELRPELQERVVGVVDRGALRQMLINLLDNALKYGPAGQRVVVGLAVFGESARLWVDDEGPGIAPEDLEKVFSPFYRSQRETESRVAGSGIGLAVVREIATAHGGRAWAETAPGGGARVSVELPGAHVRPAADEGDWVAA